MRFSQLGKYWYYLVLVLATYVSAILLQGQVAVENKEDVEEQAHAAVMIQGKVDFSKPLFKKYRKPSPTFKRVMDSTSLVLDSQSAVDSVLFSSNPREKEERAFSTSRFHDNNPKHFFDSLLAIYKTNIRAQLAKRGVRSDIIIRYYTHEADGDKVYSLRDLGYYIHERPVEQAFANYESNAVYYGDNVGIDELKLVIFTLVANGMPIRHVSPSKFHDGWKASSIEIGTDTLSLRSPVLDSEDIMKLSLN